MSLVDPENQESATASAQKREASGSDSAELLKAFYSRVEYLRGLVVDELVFSPHHATPVQIGGVFCQTPQQVITAYRPGSHHTCSPEEWSLIGPFLRACVSKTPSKSPATTHIRMIHTATFVVWAMRDDVPLREETIFLPDRVERFVATFYGKRSERSRSTVRANLRAVGTACTRRAPWPQQPVSLSSGSHSSHPYEQTVIDQYWEVAASQATALRRHTMTTMLCLGLGAGLRRSEIFELRTSHIIPHPLHESVQVAVLPDRLVPIRHGVNKSLHRICAEQPKGRLIGGRTSSVMPYDQLGRMREALDIPKTLPTFNVARLRTTWAVACLEDGVNLAEFMRMAAITSGRALSSYLPYLTVRDTDDEWVLHAAGFSAPTQSFGLGSRSETKRGGDSA